MTQCETLFKKCLLECNQPFIKMGAIQSQLKTRKSRRHEKKLAKRQQVITIVSSEREISAANEPLSPPNKRKIANLLKNLSPKPKNKNEISQETSSVNHDKDLSLSNNRTDREGSNLSNKMYMLSDSQADSAINLDNQSDSAIQLLDNSETFRESYSEAVNSEITNIVLVNIDKVSDSIVLCQPPCDSVQVIVNETSATFHETLDQEDTAKYLVCYFNFISNWDYD